MSSSKLFRKEISVLDGGLKLTHGDKFMLLGSCFSQNIAKLLRLNAFEVLDPYGTLYNPITIADNILRAINLVPYVSKDLIKQDDLYLSWNHSSTYRSFDSSSFLDHINKEQLLINNQIKDTSTLIITLGTAFVYEHNSYGIVGNCHKQPAKEFSKRMLSIKELVDKWKVLIPLLKIKNIIFTVSPVRHWSDGVVENTRSKAILHLFVKELQESFEHVYYFHSYELMLDELRDYRFYKQDMLHPSKEAIAFIWDAFKKFNFSKKTLQIIDDVCAIRKSLDHKPFNANSIKHKEFLNKLILKIETIKLATPNYSWDKEVNQLLKAIND